MDMDLKSLQRLFILDILDILPLLIQTNFSFKEFYSGFMF